MHRFDTYAEWAGRYKEHVKEELSRRIEVGSFPELERQKLVLAALAVRQLLREGAELIDEDELSSQDRRRFLLAQEDVEEAADAAYEAFAAGEVLDRRAAAEREEEPSTAQDDFSNVVKLDETRRRRRRRVS